jgi:hypothetical protein
MAYLYDVFISHAVEDKIPFVTELCCRLKKEGLSIWYSGAELNSGDSISRAIDEGLDNSRYGIVVLSPNYLAKNWPLREFYLLLAREKNGEKVILPVLYNITPEELALEDLTMADRMGIKASLGIDIVVDRLLKAIHKDKASKKKRQKDLQNKIAVALGIAVAVMFSGYGVVFMREARKLRPSDEILTELLEERIATMDSKIASDYVAPLTRRGAVPVGKEQIDSAFTAFQNAKMSFRNEYEFHSSERTIRSKKNVNAGLLIHVESLRPADDYGFKGGAVRYWLTERSSGFSNVLYGLVNTDPATWAIQKKEFVNDSTFAIKVQYESGIRYIEVKLSIAGGPRGMKRHEMELVGFAPEESYRLVRRGRKWVIAK